MLNAPVRPPAPRIAPPIARAAAVTGVDPALPARICTFSLGALRMGIDVLAVQEVLRPLPRTPVPLAPPAVAGLVNLRGCIVTVLDLHQRLQVGPALPDAERMLVLVRAEGGPVALLVDDVGEVLELEPGCGEPPPEQLAPLVREVVSHVVKLPGRLLLLLSPARVIEPPPRAG